MVLGVWETHLGEGTVEDCVAPGGEAKSLVDAWQCSALADPCFSRSRARCQSRYLEHWFPPVIFIIEHAHAFKIVADICGWRTQIMLSTSFTLMSQRDNQADAHQNQYGPIDIAGSGQPVIGNVYRTRNYFAAPPDGRQSGQSK